MLKFKFSIDFLAMKNPTIAITTNPMTTKFIPSV